MAATHTYTVVSNSYIPGPDDPIVTIAGTVDTIPPSQVLPVTITLWKSAYDQALIAGILTLEALVAPLMLAAYNAQIPPAPVQPVNQITGTFTL